MGGTFVAIRERSGLWRRTMRTGSAKQSAEKPARAKTTRNILRSAKGWILIKTIFVMAVISTPYATAIQRQLRGLTRLGGISKLVPHQRSGKTKALLSFDEIRLDSQRCFVVLDCGVIISFPPKNVAQLLMRDLE